MRDAKKAGFPFAVLDGTLVRTDRVAADRPFFSGKHHCHGMNLQVLAGPAGQLLWVSGALPGSVHDMKAAWIWGIERELTAAGLPALADKGYQGAVHARTPYRGKGKPESQKVVEACGIKHVAVLHRGVTRALFKIEPGSWETITTDRTDKNGRPITKSAFWFKTIDSGPLFDEVVGPHGRRIPARAQGAQNAIYYWPRQP